jgi:hypothetical protein
MVGTPVTTESVGRVREAVKPHASVTVIPIVLKVPVTVGVHPNELVFDELQPVGKLVYE